MPRREPAWRVTAWELEAAVEEERGSGDRAASYLISPFGGRLNRVLLAGTLSPAEPVGRDESQPFWRARLVDPTGTVVVTAGSFQPRAMAQLRAGTEARPALVVGKVHLYRGRDGVAYVSVRAEALRAVAEAEERSALAESVGQSLDRLDLLARMQPNPGVEPDTYRSEGIPLLWLTAARESLRRFPEADRAPFRASLAAAVQRIAGQTGVVVPPPSVPSVTIHRTPPAAAKTPPTAAERAEESLVLAVLDQVAEASLDGYADRRELLARVGSQGLTGPRAEAVLARLEDEEEVEEPIVGKLRLRTDPARET
ncbi:MAG TPA: hypothetical protein VK424_02880 [Thermoplasmata archaeon]|nr:hypothetical protein [Thermoplasmata archaeon]